jgi:hypothetical protein
VFKGGHALWMILLKNSQIIQRIRKKVQTGVFWKKYYERELEKCFKQQLRMK